MKRFLSLLLCICMLLSILPATVFAATTVANGMCGDYMTWALDSDGVLTINGTGDMTDYTYSYAPWYDNRSKIKQVVIANGVTSIGDRAFYYCTGLTSVTIPNGVTSIGDQAFESCSALASVTISSSVKTIGICAFQSCYGLTGITIPEGVVEIEDYAFASCTALASVTISSGVTSIGFWAFHECNNLTSFSVDDANPAYCSDGNGVLFNKAKTTLICYPAANTSAAYVIPDSVTSINEYAFAKCPALTSVTIPSSVKTIGYSAFENCTGLTGVTIPSSVTAIGNYAFRDCSGLTSATISGSVKSINYGAFMNCTGLTSVTIPGSVTSIGDSAFSGCSGLTSVRISEGVTSIGSSAFRNCTGLTSVTIPGSVTSIGDSAFSGCTSIIGFSVNSANTAYATDSYNVLFNKSKTTLISYPAGNVRTGYTIPSSVTSIESYAFSGCTGLTSVTIPGSVTSIGDYAFYGCSGLTGVTIPDGVTIIGNSTFEGCSGLTSVTILGSVTSIGSYAFEDCTSLTSFTIPASVTFIGSSAFRNCTGLTSVTIPRSVTSIGNSAFIGCRGVTRFSVAAANTAYSSDENGVMFNKNKTTLLYYPAASTSTAYTIPDSVTSFGSSAIQNCTHLTSVTIPSSVTKISLSYTTSGGVIIHGGYFWQCTALKEIIVDSANTAYSSDDGVLFNKDKTELIRYPMGKTDTAYTIPSGVTTIGTLGFAGCTNLAHLTVPTSVTFIGTSTVTGCSNLTDVYYEESEAQWNEIHIHSTNDSLLAATIHYHAKGPLEEITIQNTAVAVGAVVSAPASGWVEGTNTFSVSCEKPCYVAVSYDGGQTYRRIAATEADGSYSFTADNMNADTLLVVGLIGDVNADGAIKARDARTALQAANDMITLTPLQLLAADLDNNGSISDQEARLLLQAASNLYALSW